MTTRIEPPTQFLPPLRTPSSAPPRDIQSALEKLQHLYSTSPSNQLAAVTSTAAPGGVPPQLAVPAIQKLKAHSRAQTKFKEIPPAPTPDSGYASADEGPKSGEDAYDEDEEDGEDKVKGKHAAILAEPMEKAYATRWLGRLISTISLSTSDDEDEETNIERILDQASSLLSLLTSLPSSESSLYEKEEEPTEPHLTRQFTFSPTISVVLNDAPLSSLDHTSVGLQSWASAQVLAGRIAADPARYGLLNNKPSGVRILELGAGTGLVSIAAAKILQEQNNQGLVWATDYHPDVLSNLSLNVASNGVHGLVRVASLDWELPFDSQLSSAPFPSNSEQMADSSPFDLILAADTIYLPSHASLHLQICSRALRGNHNSTFWLAVPRREVGRHEGVVGGVDEVFCASRLWSQGGETSADDKERLVILEREEVGRLGGGVGRADESGYLVFKIGWQKRPWLPLPCTF